MTLKSEQCDQIAIFDWLRLNKLDHISFHVANERATKINTGRLLKRMGVTAGVSDLFIMRAREGFHGLIIELKAKSGRLSRSQQVFLDNMTLEGYKALVCYGFDETIWVIKKYLGMH